MSLLKSIFNNSVKIIVTEAIDAILKEATRREKITPSQKDLITEIAAELGHIKLKK
jgi:hypothetical protein